jgi:hypothetical protein
LVCFRELGQTKIFFSNFDISFIAAYYGQTDFCKELLIQFPENIPSKIIDGNQNLDRVVLEVL